MKYYSESLKKVYDSEKECQDAEREYAEKVAAEKAEREKLQKARKERAAEVESARQAYLEAQKSYIELRNKFINDFGGWHMTVSTSTPRDLIDLFDTIFA